MTFTSTSTAIFVYWKTYFSTKPQLRAVPNGEIFRIHFSALKKFRVKESIFLNSRNFSIDESIFLNSKIACGLIKNKLFSVEFIFLNPNAGRLLNCSFMLISKFTKIRHWEEENIFSSILLNSKDCVLTRKNSLQLQCWLFGLLIYWLANVQSCSNFFIGAQNLSGRNLSG